MVDLVSVLIPAYNAEGTLGDALESVLAQTHGDIEVVVVDDGSGDRTVELARSYAGVHPNQVRVLVQENAGACAARNHALAESTAPFIKFLDADDVLSPDAIEVQLQSVSPHDTVSRVVSYGDLVVTDQALRSKGHPPSPGDIGASSADPIKRVSALLSKNIQTSLPLHRREWLVEVGGFRTHLRRAQEYDLHLRLTLAGVRFVHIPHVITRLRQHGAPDRISNTSPMLDDPEHHLRTLRERRLAIGEVVGLPLPASVAAALARGIWTQMQRLVQDGQLDAARRYAAEASLLDPGLRHAGPFLRAFSVLGGPVRAEQFLVRARRLSSFVNPPTS